MRGSAVASAFSLVAFLFLPLVSQADDVRIHYDRNGNVVVLQEAAATALAIEDVRPGYGTPGDLVTIFGTGFSTAPAANSVTFNGTSATVAAAAENALTVTVPAGATSGHVTVTVAGSTVQSPADFVILPAAFPSATMSNAQEITLDGPSAAVASVSSRTAAVSFVLPQGKYASLQFGPFTGASTASVTYSVYKPDGSMFMSGSVSTTAPTILLSLTPAAGVYTVYLKTPGWFRSSVALSSDPEWIVNGDPLPITSAQPYQKRRVWFSGGPAQNLCWGYSNLALTPTTAGIPTFALYKPDGTTLTSLVNLPVTGAYSLVMTPSSSATATSVSLWLSPELSGALSLNSSTPLGVTRPGQRGRYTFTGAQGDNIGLAMSATTTTGGVRASAYLYDPSGAIVLNAPNTIATSSGNWPYWANLPASGTYTVLLQIDPLDNQNNTWATTLTLSKDVAATIAVDGSPTSASTSLIGQQIRATFSATAGQNLCFAYTNLTQTPSGLVVPVFRMYRPDGVAFTSLVNLPQTGTYTILVTPNSGVTSSSLQLWLSSELTGSLAVNSSTPLSVSRPGQRMRLTFPGTQGDHMRLAMSSTSTNPAGSSVGAYLFSPTGAIVLNGATTIATPSGNWEYSALLPATGTYSLLVQINPNSVQNYAWATTVTLSKDVDASITVDGPATSVATTLLGQEIRATFDATAGQTLDFAYMNLVKTPSSGTAPTFTYFRPDGTAQTASLANLTQTGTYTIVITPSTSVISESMDLWLSTEATGNVSLGTATPLSVSRPGQRGRYTFQASQGQILKFTLASTATNPTGGSLGVYIYKPDGTALITGSGYFVVTATTTNYTTVALPVTGTYTVFIGMNPVGSNNASWATTLTIAPQ